MKRVALVSVGAAAAVCAAAVPAVVGLVGNTSFSHHIPVRVPVGASAASLGSGPPRPSHTRAVDPASRSAEPSETRSEDAGGHHSRGGEPADHDSSPTEDRSRHGGRGSADGSGSSGGGRGGPGRSGGEDRHVGGHSGRG
jgi:hypothetical protein